jgi:putative peptidoglycan lipid II flippase
MPVTNSAVTANRQIARAAGTVMAAFVLSNLTGLVRQILVSNAFGTSIQLDAYNAASTYPDFVFNLIAGGALASAFIPTLTGFLAKGDRREGWQLASSIINLVLLVLTGISLVSAFLAPQIMRLIYIMKPTLDPQVQAMAAELLRILLISPVIFGVSGLLMGVLNVHQVFLWPALAPSMYWLGMIFGLLFLVPSMGIYGLAWGAVIGAGLHFLVQLPTFLRLPERHFTLTLGLHLPAVREVARLMGPRLLGVGVVQINAVVNAMLATAQPIGSLTAIKYAWAIMTMPQVVIAQAIAIAALPTFSAQFARGELSGMRASLAATLRGVILLALPATLGLILLREQVIAVLFQHGEFDAHSTQLVSWALLWYTAGLVGHSVVEIVSRAFYAMHDTKTPVLVGAVAMSLNLGFSFLFSAWFERLGWMPHGGLALANSLATALEMVGLLFFMRRRLNGLDGRFLMAGVWPAILATLAMSLALWGWLAVLPGRSIWLLALGGVLLGGGVYALGVLGLGVAEAKSLVRVVRVRLGFL